MVYPKAVPSPLTLSVLLSCALVVLHTQHGAALPIERSTVIKTYNLVDDAPPTSYDFFVVPFYVPTGVAEITVQHTHIGNVDNILDWGLADPRGACGLPACDATRVMRYNAWN